jgi:arsenate reductase
MSAGRRYNVLFLCTGNSARSIIGEALLNHMGGDRFRAFSAGSAPKGEVHPMSLAILEAAGIATTGLRSKGWDAFALPDAPQMDFILTVCDSAAGEACPIWPGRPASAHWGIEDPAAVTDDRGGQRAVFERAMALLRLRIEALVALPIETLDPTALSARLRAIGALEGATAKARAS